MVKNRKYLSLNGDEFLVHENEISKFFDLVESTKLEYECTYLEAIQISCEKNNIDVSSVGALISPILREKLEAEAVTMNLVKKSPKRNTLDD